MRDAVAFLMLATSLRRRRLKVMIHRTTSSILQFLYAYGCRRKILAKYVCRGDVAPGYGATTRIVHARIPTVLLLLDYLLLRVIVDGLCLPSCGCCLSLVLLSRVTRVCLGGEVLLL